MMGNQLEKGDPTQMYAMRMALILASRTVARVGEEEMWQGTT